MARIAIIVAHARKDTYCEALGEAYRRGAETGGHKTKLFVTSRMVFDPILHEGFVKFNRWNRICRWHTMQSWRPITSSLSFRFGSELFQPFSRVFSSARCNRTLWSLPKKAGIKGLSNEILIKPRAQASDVKLLIETALRRNAELEAGAIKVAVLNGRVTLDGKVTRPCRTYRMVGAWYYFGRGPYQHCLDCELIN